MSARLSTPALCEVALKWRALAERRRAHLVELYDSGRWQRYFSETQLIESMREAIRQSERWAEIAPHPGEMQAATVTDPSDVADEVPPE
jgi:uncharacterized repeat protein (TIGR03809 family)